MQVPGEEREPAHGTGGGRAPSEAASERNEASARSERTAEVRSEASSGAGCGQGAGRAVIVPMPSREDLGTTHLDPPLARVTPAARQPDPARQQRVAPGPDGRQRHGSAVWDLAVKAQWVQADLRISFPCPLVIRGGSNLPAGQELVGMFAYRLVSGHWRVQTGVAGSGEEGRVTTAGIVGLSVVAVWEKRRPEWVDVAWLAMRVHVGRWRNGGVDVIDVEGEEEPPPAVPARRRKAQPPPPPSGHRCAPPPKGPRTGTPAERAARDRPRGAVDEWVEQQQQQRAISAEAAQRDVEAPLSRANEDGRATETEWAAVRRDKDCLAARVKRLERDLASARRATWGRPPGQTGEGEPESPAAEGWRHPIPPAFVTFWPGCTHCMRWLRQRRHRCRLSPWASARRCWRVAKRSRWRKWRLTWPGSLPPTRS